MQLQAMPDTHWDTHWGGGAHKSSPHAGTLSRARAHPSASARTPGLPLALALLVLASAPVHAGDECGALDPATDSGRTIECTTDTYETTTGNIFYQLPDTPTDVDYTLDLGSGLTLTGTRNAAQVTAGAETDDHSRRWNRPGETWANYGAVYIDTGFNHTGDITLRSAATITTGNADGVTIDQSTLRARGIYARHHGRSGDLSLSLTGGTITSTGPGIHAMIDSGVGGCNDAARDQQASCTGTFFKDADFAGTLAINLSPGVRIRTSGERGHGISAQHRGSGAIRLSATGRADPDDPDIEVTGADAGGIDVEMGNWWDPITDFTGGSIAIDLTDLVIRTTGDRGQINGSGVKAYMYIRGDIAIDLTGSTVRAERARGIFAANFSPHASGGDIAITVRGSTVETGPGGGNHEHAIIGQHRSTGLVAITVTGSEITTRGPGQHAVYGRHFAAGDVRITTRNNRITAHGSGSYGIYGHQQNHPSVPPGPTGAITIDVTGDRITTHGSMNSPAIYARHEGTGPITITAKDTTIRTEGDNHAIHAHHLSRGMAGDTRVRVEGGTLATTANFANGIEVDYASRSTTGDATIELINTNIRNNSGGIRASVPGDTTITLTGSTVRGGDSGIVAFFSRGTTVMTLGPGSRVEGTVRSVEWWGHPGRLVMAGGTAVGNIRFAFGDHDDVLAITGPGMIVGSVGPGVAPETIAFLGGHDTMTVTLPAGQHFAVLGPISGLEILHLTAGNRGTARLAGPMTFAGSTMTLESGTLVVADTVDLPNGDVIIHPGARLVLEAGLTADGDVTYGSLLADTLSFHGDPALHLQLDADLTADQVSRVRGRIGSDPGGVPLLLTNTGVRRCTAADACDGTDGTPLETVTIHSGPNRNIGTLDTATGRLTDLDAGRITQLDPGARPPAGPTAPPAIGDVPAVGDTATITWLTSQAPRTAYDRIAGALPAILLDLNTSPLADAPRAPGGTGFHARILGAAGDRDLKDATAAASYSLDRRGLALGHDLATPAGTLSLTLRRQTGSAAIGTGAAMEGGTIGTVATGLAVAHSWALETVTVALHAAATAFTSDLATPAGTLASGLGGRGLAAGVEAATRRPLGEATLTVGGGLFHQRVTADGFTAGTGNAAVRVAGVRGETTTARLRADWSRPRPAGSVFAGARLDVPLDGSAAARVGATPLTSKPRAALGVQGGLVLDGAALALGYETTGASDSLHAGLSVRF